VGLKLVTLHFVLDPAIILQAQFPPTCSLAVNNLAVLACFNLNKCDCLETTVTIG